MLRWVGLRRLHEGKEVPQIPGNELGYTQYTLHDNLRRRQSEEEAVAIFVSDASYNHSDSKAILLQPRLSHSLSHCMWRP